MGPAAWNAFIRSPSQGRSSSHPAEQQSCGAPGALHQLQAALHALPCCSAALCFLAELQNNGMFKSGCFDG